MRRLVSLDQLPLDEQDRLRLSSGVHVDEHGVSQTEREVEATPSSGIELRF